MSTMFLWAVFLPLLWTLQVHGLCPDPGSIYPCTCHTVSDKFGQDFSVLSCKYITSEATLMRVVAATRNHRLFELQLINSTLRYIPHDTFEGTTFEFISIEDSAISALSDTDIAFKGLDDTLHMLEVVNCSFVADWNWTQLSHLKHMMEVNVQDSELLDITNGLSTVQHLDFTTFVFSGNKIQWLDTEVFATFEFLTRLTLNRNYISRLQRSMFPRPANSLRIMGLSYNRLTRLPRDLFADMPALKSVYLTGNPLQTIEEVVFKPVWHQIELLYFNDTGLSCDCRLTWMKQIDNKGKYIHADCYSPSHVKGKAVANVQMHELWCYQ